MRLVANILTPLTAFCLFGSGFDWAVREKQFGQPMIERANEDGGRVDAVLLRVQCNDQTGDPQLAHVRSAHKGEQYSSERLPDPAFLKYRLLFSPNALNLTARSRNTLKCAAAWLRQHREDRVLIVGYCDASGSEACTAALAERRGEIVRQFLLSLGAEPDQIAGVKGWDNLDQSCRVETAKCQRLNRSARLFIKGSAGSLR